MHNPNPSSNIEPSSLSSNPEPPRPEPYPGIDLLPQNPNYLPQIDSDLSPQNLSYQGPQYSIWSKLCRKKAVNLPILFILCLSILDIIPICGGVFYFFKELYTGSSLDMQYDMPHLLQYLSADLNADPIMDIQIMKEGSTCPSGFEILNLGTWPGTVDGCICDGGELWITRCEYVGKPQCKKDLPANSPIEMYEWDDSIWCVKKAVLGKDYLRKAECPTGYKECYPGGCFLKECPVTKVKITSQSQLFNDTQDNYLTLTKSPGEPPLINIQMTFGNIPCFIQDLFSQTIKNSTYGLTTIRDGGCDKYGLDTHSSTILASQTAYSSFEQNNFPYSVMHLPYFDAHSMAKMSILSSKARMKTGNHDYCQDINDEPINKYFEAANTFPELTCSLGYLFLLVPRLLVIIEILARRPKRWRVEFFENTPELMKKLYQWSFWFSFLMIAYFVTFRSYQRPFQAAKDYFEGYETLECFGGGQGSMIVNDYLQNLKIIENSFWIHWALYVSSSLAGGISFWLYIVKNKLPRYNLTL